MKTSKKGFLIFMGLILALLASIHFVNTSYKKAQIVKTVRGNDALLNEQNLLILDSNILSYPEEDEYMDQRLARTNTYLLSTSNSTPLTPKRENGKLVFADKKTTYEPKTSVTLGLKVYYKYIKNRGFVKIHFQDYKGNNYSAISDNKDIVASAKTEDLNIYRIEKYKGQYQCAFSYYNNEKKSYMLAFASIEDDKFTLVGESQDKGLTILGENRDSIQYRWARYAIVAFDKMFVFDYSDESGNFRPSTLSFDFKDHKISRHYFEKDDPLYDVFNRDPRDNIRTELGIYIKYLEDKNQIVRVCNPTNSKNFHAYIIELKDGRLVAKEDIDLGIRVSPYSKKVQDKGDQFVFDANWEANIFLNGDKLIFSMSNNGNLMDKKHYQYGMNLNPLKKIYIYGLDTKRIDYEGILMGAVSNQVNEIYATTKSR